MLNVRYSVSWFASQWSRLVMPVSHADLSSEEAAEKMMTADPRGSNCPKVHNCLLPYTRVIYKLCFSKESTFRDLLPKRNTAHVACAGLLDSKSSIRASL